MLMGNGGPAPLVHSHLGIGKGLGHYQHDLLGCGALVAAFGVGTERKVVMAMDGNGPWIR